ncbi:MAG: GIY-YIG nuclease family protein, partial [Bacteroidota bacterium]
MAKRKKKSSKGALIKGMSKKIPKIMLDDISFRNRMKDILRGYSGIYALYNGHKLYYVGLAKDLFWRLHSHGRNRH